MLCLQNFYPTSPRWDIKHNVLCLCTLHTDLFDYILWKLYPYHKNIQNPKKIFPIMTKSNNRSSCKQLFQKLGLLPLQCQYILPLLSFVVQNKDQFNNNVEIHNMNTRHNMYLHPPSLNLTLSEKGVHYSGIRLFNHLPVLVKQLAGDIKLFKPALRNLLRLHTFYSIQEYLELSLT
jgi:hypothetical protein